MGLYPSDNQMAEALAEYAVYEALHEPQVHILAHKVPGIRLGSLAMLIAAVEKMKSAETVEEAIFTQTEADAVIRRIHALGLNENLDPV